MKRKKRGLGWYVGMVFGDPVSLADPDAPGMPPGGPWWAYLAMWAVIGLILAVIPGLIAWRIFWLDPGPPGPAPHGATNAFDGTYLGVEERVIDERGFLRRCSSGGPPRPFTISDGIAGIAGYGVEGEVSADGRIRITDGSSLYVLHVDRRGTVEGTAETRYCTYHVMWKKE
jgi:hypothetical protein